jgi:DtxR family Mn-dependent transcriptional regulator
VCGVNQNGLNKTMPEIDALGESTSLQKGGLNHQAIEDYLKTIYMLAQEESPVSTSRIAEARQVKPGSATGMIKRLSKLALVDYQKHYGVTLTAEGERIALEVIRHHRLIELYLIEALDFGWDEVHEQADILEHVISEKLEEHIARALGYPEFDPHGAPIPTKELVMPDVSNQPLATLAVGDTAVVSRITWPDEDGEMLRYVGGLGLTPGAIFTVVEVAPFDGPITVQIADDQKVVGHNVATAVLVEKIDS